MSNYLKQSTAACIMLGPLVDNTDGFSPETALTFNATDIRISKNGEEFAAKNDSTAPSSNEFGWWEVTLNTTDTNVVGEYVIAASVTGALPVWRTFMVLNASSYDALVNGVGGLTVRTGSNNDKTGYILGASSIGASTLAASAITDNIFTDKAASSIWNSTVRLITGGSVVAISGSVTVINNLDKTNYILAASSIAASTFAASAITDNIVTDKSASSHWNVAVRTLTDKTNYGLSASAVDEIWNESNAGHSTASTYGWFVDKQISAVVSGSSSGATAADVWTYAARTLSASSIAASTLANNAIDANSFATNAASKVWDAGVRTITGGSVTTNSDKTGYGLSGSALGEISASVATASGVWTYITRTLSASSISASTIAASTITNQNFAATAGSVIWNVAIRGLTDKANFILAASSISPSTIAASTITDNIVTDKAASAVWNSAVKVITGGSVVATSGSVITITNLDKTNYTLATSTISDTTITDAARNEISKNLLAYNMASISGEADRSPLNALRFLRNKWSATGSTLIVYEEDDTTTAWTATLTTASSACPIVGNDPI